MYACGGGESRRGGWWQCVAAGPLTSRYSFFFAWGLRWFRSGNLLPVAFLSWFLLFFVPPIRLLIYPSIPPQTTHAQHKRPKILLSAI